MIITILIIVIVITIVIIIMIIIIIIVIMIIVIVIIVMMVIIVTILIIVMISAPLQDDLGLPGLRSSAAPRAPPGARHPYCTHSAIVLVLLLDA